VQEEEENGFAVMVGRRDEEERKKETTTGWPGGEIQDLNKTTTISESRGNQKKKIKK
jgi:hypothetical protein